MSNRFPIVISFVLVAAVAEAQVVRAPKPPKALALPAPVLAPVELPDLSALSIDLGRLRTEFELNLEPVIAQTTAMSIEPLALAGDLVDLDAFWQGPSTGQVWVSGDGESAAYSRGTSYLDQGKYQQAVEAFDKAITANGKRTDGAMYWKAYALNRLGRGPEALAVLDEMLKKFASSRWANDARALQVEIRQASGRTVNPAQQTDEELKLIALNGVVSRDPERGIPMVEQILAGSASPRMKERALFVLAQSGSPRAKTVLTDVARGKGNPDLQLKALDYLGMFGPDVPLLLEVYRGTSDVEVKRHVIRSLALTGRRGFGSGARIYFEPELSLARAFASSGAAAKIAGEVSAETREKVAADMERLRSEFERTRAEAERTRAEAESNLVRAQRSTGTTIVRTERDKAREAKAKEASDALWQLYQGESSNELKREILRNMYFGDQADRLVQIARTEKDPQLRRSALQAMMFSRTPKTAETLVALYRDEKDPSVKRQIIDALATMDSAGPLVQLARQESDLQLKRSIVQRLSYMKDKEATDYMLELLKK